MDKPWLYHKELKGKPDENGSTNVKRPINKSLLSMVMLVKGISVCFQLTLGKHLVHPVMIMNCILFIILLCHYFCPFWNSTLRFLPLVTDLIIKVNIHTLFIYTWKTQHEGTCAELFAWGWMPVAVAQPAVLFTLTIWVRLVNLSLFLDKHVVPKQTRPHILLFKFSYFHTINVPFPVRRTGGQEKSWAELIAAKGTQPTFSLSRHSTR